MVKKGMYIFLFVFLSVLLISCDENVTTEQYNDEILIKNEIIVDGIGNYQKSGLISSNDYTAVYSYTGESGIINVYDINTDELIIKQEEFFEDFFIRGIDISDDYLVYIGFDFEIGKIVVRYYSFISDQLFSITVDDNNDSIIAENPIQIVNNKILVNLSTGYKGEGFTYLINIDNISEPIIVANYDINHMIMDATFEKVYGGANKIINNKIVMSSYNYVDTHNRVDIYNLKDGTLNRSLEASDSEDMTCNVLNTQIVDSYIVLKALCTNDIQKFVIYDAYDESIKINIELPYDIEEYKIKDINSDYVLLTDGNYNSDNAKLLIYDINLEIINEIEGQADEIKFFGAVSYLFNQRVAYINNRTLYVYDLEEEEYLTVEEQDINKIYGMYNQFIIFELIINEEKQIWAYNMIDNEFDYIFELSSEIYDLNIKDRYIFIFEEKDENNLYILE